MFLSGYCLSLSQKFAQGISQAKLQEDPRQTPTDPPVLLAGQRRVCSKLESLLGQGNASTEPE